MDSFYGGPERSGKNSLPNSRDPALNASSQKTTNTSVKSKLRQLAEFRRRSKEFGSNDSLHLTPLHRSLSDPWLLKGTLDKGLDLSKPGSSSIMDLSKIDHTSSNGMDLSRNSANDSLQDLTKTGSISSSRMSSNTANTGMDLSKAGKVKKKQVGILSRLQNFSFFMSCIYEKVWQEYLHVLPSL